MIISVVDNTQLSLYFILHTTYTLFVSKRFGKIFDFFYVLTGVFMFDKSRIFLWTKTGIHFLVEKYVLVNFYITFLA